jgi:uncharacterized protein
MHNPWTQLKSRYLILDIALAFVAVIFALAFLEAISTSLFGLSRKEIESLSEYPSYILVMGLICVLFISRLQKNGIDWQKMTGALSFKEIPLMLTLIIFQADFMFSIGMEYINIFIVYQFSPELVKSSAEKVDLVTNNISSLPLQIQIFCYIFTAIAAIIVAPLTEEFIFRGVLMHRWAIKWGITASIILTSAVFALAHGDIYILPRFSGAIISAIVYCNTGLLSISIGLHAMNNFIVTFMSFLKPFASNSQEDAMTIYNLIYGILYSLLPLPVLFYFLKWPDSVSKLPYLSRLNNTSEK